MAATPIPDQVSYLLSLRVAEAKTNGVPSPDIESASILESIGLSLLLKPKTILYAATLAANGLSIAAQAELAQIQVVLNDLTDLNNRSFAITDTSDLVSSKTALLQISDQQKVENKSSAYTNLDTSITNFLTNHLAKNVVKPNSSTFVRPAVEAAQDLLIDFALLQTLHTDFLDRLLSLYQGVPNFMSSPLSTIIGTATVHRSSLDIQSIIDSIANDPSGTGSSDYATRLITDRAALKTIGQTPDYSLPELDSATQLPVGYNVQAISDQVAVALTTAVGPFGNLGTSNSDSLTIGVSGGTPIVGSTSNLLQALNGPAILGSVVTYPVTIPTNYNLFLTLVVSASVNTGWSLEANGITYIQTTLGSGWTLNIDGTYSQTFLVALTASMTIANVISAINSSGPANAHISALEFVEAGTGRLLIYASSSYYASISIASAFTGLLSGTTSTYVYNLSASSYLGFTDGQIGVYNQIPAQQLSDAINIVFGSLVVASVNSSGSISIESVSTTQGVYLTIAGTWATALAIAGVFNATTTNVTLQGAINNLPTNPINPITLVNIGDSVATTGGISVISLISDVGIVLANPINTFALSNITITSALYITWLALNAAVTSQISVWSQSPYNQNLDNISKVIATISGTTFTGNTNSAVTLLNNLNTLLNNLVTALGVIALPSGSASQEILNSDNIVTTLLEKKYDKAVDYYHRLKVAEIFFMDYQTASYAGAVMSAASDLSQKDMVYPNKALDQGVTASGFQNRSGII